MARSRRIPSRSLQTALIGLSSLAWGPWVHGGDIARPARAAEAAPSTGTAGQTSAGLPTPERTAAAARIKAARDAAAKTRELQATAATLARSIIASQKTAENTWRITTPGSANPVVVTGGLSSSGLMVRPGGVWSGAAAPVDAGSNSGFEHNIEVKQTAQQAILDWESFNVASNTRLHFDQTSGGENTGNWIAFNRIGVTGRPSVILGRIDAEGQVYVINPNGILFGGGAQVNTHALVASTLPINENLIERGLLNNPDAQFLFSGFSQAAGAAGPTAASRPKVTDIVSFPELAASKAISTNRPVADATSTEVVARGADGAALALNASTDFTQTYDAATGATSLTLSESGVAKAAGGRLEISYTPTASSSGDVRVEAGASLYAPTTGNNVGGRIALIGANVSNAGHLAAPDGQIILAAGLEVGFAAHASSDPSLRGLDTYVGRISDSFSSVSAGKVTNEAAALSNGTAVQGLIETRDLERKDDDGKAAPEDVAGAITLTGREIRQEGVLRTTTTVSFNGRIDLNASYNATPYVPVAAGTAETAPFLYGAASDMPATGLVEFGINSSTSVLVSDSTTERIAGLVSNGVSLRSQINVTGKAIHLAGSASGGASIVGTNGNLKFLAGDWTVLNPTNPDRTSQFYRGSGQIYLDQGTTIDASGTQGARASVSDLVVEAQLRGTELANSPSQRDGALRGAKVMVDTRVHGPWDPTLNNGAGGYTWVGTPLGNVSGWIALAEHSAEQLTTAGGSIDLQAGDSIVMSRGSTLDVSGGWTEYAAGRVETSKVVTGGRVIDISQATPDKVYSGLFTGATATENKTWGVTEAEANSVLVGYNDPGYWEGGAGGRLSMASDALAIDGTLLGRAFSGSRQTLIAPLAGSLSLVAKPSELVLKTTSQVVNPNFGNAIVEVASNPADVHFVEESTLASTDPVASFDENMTSSFKIDEERQRRLEIETTLFSDGEFGFLTLDAGNDYVGSSGRTSGVFGNVFIGETGADSSQTLLRFTAQSAVGRHLGLQTLNITGANIFLNQGISAPGSLLRMVSTNFSASASALNNQTIENKVSSLDPLIPLANRGTISVAKGISIDTSGLEIDARAGGSFLGATRGGDISLNGFKVDMGTGAVLDVSGGVAFGSGGTQTWGSAGTIELLAKNEQQFDGAALTLSASNRGFGSGGGLRGYSGLGTGGTLRFSSTNVAIVPKDLDAGIAESDQRSAVTPLWLKGEFFSQGGFSNFSVTGLSNSRDTTSAALRVGELPGTNEPADAWTIAPRVATLAATFDKAGNYTLAPVTYAESGRQAPVSLSFATAASNVPSSSLPNPGFLWEESVSLALPASSSSLLSVVAEDIRFLGDVFAPGGGISLQARTSTSSTPTINVQVGKNATLSTAGAVRSALDRYGQEVGTVLAGGKITVQGNAVLESGAVLDVSGAQGTLAYSAFELGNDPTLLDSTSRFSRKEESRASDGGSITLTGVAQLHADATLSGKAGGVGATGGVLSVGSGLYSGGSVAPESEPSLLLTASSTYKDLLIPSNGSLIGLDTLTSKSGEVFSTSSIDGVNYFGGRIATDSFSEGGFGFLNLDGKVKFTGAVSLSAENAIQLASGGVLVADSSAASTLKVLAPYVRVGTPFEGPLAKTPVTDSFRVASTSGSGALAVAASRWLDVGTLSLRGISKTELAALEGGDLRGNGAVSLQGELTLRAGQIYAPSASNFTIAVDNGGSIKVRNSNTDPAHPYTAGVPLTAGSSLNLFATTIDQGGVLRAPFGTIRLGTNTPTVEALGTGRTFAVAESVSLGRGSITSVSAVDYATGKVSDVAVPYGANTTGSVWIDPTGHDITVRDTAGRTTKTIDIAGQTVTTAEVSNIDLTGGGELFADRWVSGVNGTVDPLASGSASFAVLPGYHGAVAPFGAFAAGASLLQGDSGFVSSSLRIGDVIKIDLGNGAGLQTYTLLPARYALLPGAFLLTETKSSAAASGVQSDGSLVTGGYRYNGLADSAGTHPLFTSWEVIGNSSAFVSNPQDGTTSKARSQHDLSYASAFFTSTAAANQIAVRRLPKDAGQVALSATTALSLRGQIKAAAAIAEGQSNAGRGGEVDINTPGNILISDAASSGTTPGVLVLKASDLNSYQAESLLIGGRRRDADGGTELVVSAESVTLDSPTLALIGSDVTLAAKEAVILSGGSELRQEGASSGTLDTLYLATTDSTAGAAAIRVSSSTEAGLVQPAGASGAAPRLTLESSAKVSGTGVVLSSSGEMSISPSASLSGNAEGLESALSLSASRLALSSQYSGSDSLASLSALFGINTPSEWLFLSPEKLGGLAGGAGGHPFAKLNLTSASSLFIDSTKASTLGGTNLSGLQVNASEIRLFGDQRTTFSAGRVILGNAGAGSTFATSSAEENAQASLEISATKAGGAGIVRFGAGALRISGVKESLISAASGMFVGNAEGTSNSEVRFSGDLRASSPVFQVGQGNQNWIVAGAAEFGASGEPSTQDSTLGGSFKLEAESLRFGGRLEAEGGRVDMTALSGDLVVEGKIDVSGASVVNHDVVRYASAGDVALTAKAGSIRLKEGSLIDVSAAENREVGEGHALRLGKAGSISLSASHVGTGDAGGNGVVSVEGSLAGHGGGAGLSDKDTPAAAAGRITLDAGQAETTSLAALGEKLNDGGFTESRTLRFRGGDVLVDGVHQAKSFSLSVDAGSATVTGIIDASGETGGKITIAANRAVTIGDDAVLTTAGQAFDAAGKGGAISLQAGSSVMGVAPVGSYSRKDDGSFQVSAPAVSIEEGALLDVSVAAAAFNLKESANLALRPGDAVLLDQTAVFTADDGEVMNITGGTAFTPTKPGSLRATKHLNGTWLVRSQYGQATGTVHLRAPQVTEGSGEPDVLVNPISGEIRGASSIAVEGYTAHVASDGRIEGVRVEALAAAARFGTASNEARLKQALFGGMPQGRAVAHIRPGIEIVATDANTGLTLASSWDLSTSRYGAGTASGVFGAGEAGYLTLRSAGDLNFNHLASLSDGFRSNGSAGGLWQGRLLAPGSQSWSYQLVAGADLTAASSEAVASESSDGHNLVLGRGAPDLNSTYRTVTNTAIIPLFYQTVRTGTGDISLVSSGDVQWVNPLVTVYTAGQQVYEPSSVFNPGDFDLPHTNYSTPATVLVQHYGTSAANYVPYPVYYTWGGGDVRITAGGDLLRTTSTGQAASSLQMPTNWLYRRGKVASDGRFDTILVRDANSQFNDVASTSWWVDFSNFFMDVGALGGGNVSLVAGGKVENVSAVAPTNARMTKTVTVGGREVTAAAQQSLLELGGGNVTVRAGADVSGGVYYAENGDTRLVAGGQVTTNATRATISASSLANLGASVNTDPLTWLPTTFFAGKGDVEVEAKGNIKVGQIANPFLLPQGINNSYFQTTYFSTLAADAAVSVSSLYGNIDVIGNTVSAVGTLFRWYDSVLYSSPNVIGTAAARNQPWLRLAFGQSSGVPQESFGTAMNLLPSSLTLDALGGDIRFHSLNNPIILAPSAKGGLNVMAAGNIVGVSTVGLNDEAAPHDSVSNPYSFGSASILVSDASPAGIPSVYSPNGYSFGLRVNSLAFPNGILSAFNSLFKDSGATSGENTVLQTQVRLHGTNPEAKDGDESIALHADDDKPVRLYANTGDITGLSLISPKATRVVAGNDITDIALYLQNARPGDTSLVSAGRDIVAYNPVSATRLGVETTPLGEPMLGDIQISGPGDLQVLAGRNIALGDPLPAPTQDGTGAGISSIGNVRNPNLPYQGAEVWVAAGLTDGEETGSMVLRTDAFVSRYLNPVSADGGSNALAARYLPTLAAELGVDAKAALGVIWAAFLEAAEESVGESATLSRAERLALGVFFKVLRDAGRDRNDPSAANYGNYAEGFKAASTLIPNGTEKEGDFAWPTTGSIALNSRSIRTTNGGGIAIMAPGGGVALGRDVVLEGPPPGVVTEAGGDISIYTLNDVDVGASRIFTLRGGDEIIWSSAGSIAAGVSSKTVQSAPPTRVLVDPQSADVKTDLAGLATGGGIGVLATIEGVEAGDVDLVAPTGVIDAGDAGIRSSGRLFVAAQTIRNAANISSGGDAAGVPVAPPAPNVGAIASAANAASVADSKTAEKETKPVAEAAAVEAVPSMVTVEVLGYGGDDEEESKDEGSETSESAPSP